MGCDAHGQPGFGKPEEKFLFLTLRLLAARNLHMQEIL
jgi:hypothetical protein